VAKKEVAEVRSTEFVQVEVSRIRLGRDNPRRVDESDPDFLALVEDVRGSGVQVPVHLRPHVRPVDGMDDKAEFILMAGQRRWRAAKAAGLTTIPAVVHRVMDDESAFTLTVLENFDRADLKPLEQAAAVATLLKRLGEDVGEVARRLGRSKPWVRRRARLTALIPAWEEALAAPRGPYGAGVGGAAWASAHLELIARLPAPIQERLLKELQEKYAIESWTAAQLEEHINQHYLHGLAKAAWSRTDEALEPKAGACAKCEKRSGLEPLLFHEEGDDIEASDQCLDAECWRRKSWANLSARKAEAAEKYDNLVLVADDYPSQDEAQTITKEFGPFLQHYQFESCTKKAPGARPGLVVFGKGLGTIRWVQPTRKGESGGRGIAKGPASLKERKEALANRRAAYMIDQVKAELATKTYAELVEGEKPTLSRIKLIVLASVVGTFIEQVEDIWKAALELERDEGVACQALWEAVCRRLSDRIRYYSKTAVGADNIRNAARIAELLQVNWKNLQDQAAQEIPEPKSWAKLNADGTPKQS